MSEQRFKKAPVIIVPHGTTGKMAKHFGCTIQTVRNALKYISDTEQAQRIRKEAIEYYGGTETTIRIRV